jgi:hypothetical protein
VASRDSERFARRWRPTNIELKPVWKRKKRFKFPRLFEHKMVFTVARGTLILGLKYRPIGYNSILKLRAVFISYEKINKMAIACVSRPIIDTQ